MLDEEIEKKSGFSKMIDAAKQMMGKAQSKEEAKDEESQIVNESDLEAKKLIKPEAEVEDEF